MSKHKTYRDREGRIINYSSDDSDAVRYEVQLTRTEGRLERIESKQHGLRQETIEMHKKIDGIDKNISTMVQYYRETLTKQGCLENDIHAEPGGVTCRVTEVEKELREIRGGIKTGTWITGIILGLFGSAFGIIKLIEHFNNKV